MPPAKCRAWCVRVAWKEVGVRTEIVPKLQTPLSICRLDFDSLNGRLGYKIGNGMRIELEAFNLTDRRDSAIAYFYASRLKGESAATDDVHFHPLESRSARITLVKSWQG
jgi:hypothetical protein